MIDSYDTYEGGDYAYVEESDTTDVSPPNIEKIFSKVKRLSKGDEAHQPHSEGVLDWLIGTPT